MKERQKKHKQGKRTKGMKMSNNNILCGGEREIPNKNNVVLERRHIDLSSETIQQCVKKVRINLPYG